MRLLDAPASRRQRLPRFSPTAYRSLKSSRGRSRSLLVGALLGAVVLVAPARAQYELVWEDDFQGGSLDPGNWEPQIGNGCPSLCGWGNNELQYYRAENATVSGGELTITAREESFGGAQYTSARLRTKNLVDIEGGRFEMRARLPIGQGLWPAFWLLPTDNAHGVWAASGEIDVMECICQNPDQVFGTIHYGAPYPGNVYSGASYTLPNGTFHDDFHVFALEWDEFELRWYVDGTLYSTKTSWWSSGAPYPAPFNERFYLLLNLAVGGNFPGPPGPSTMFPQEYVIDYVRVYQALDLSTCKSVFDDMEHANPFGNGYFVFDGGSASGGIAADLVDLPPNQGGSASLAASWASGGASGYFGGFGRTNPLDLTGATHFELWIHPDAGQDYVLEINLQDDDNGDDTIPNPPDAADDEFQYSLHVGPAGSEAVSGGGWQHLSIPLASFIDDNSYLYGGNGVLDPFPVSVGGNGRLVNVVFSIHSNSGADVTFRCDDWTFTRRTSSISGRVWNDLDGDGLDLGEPGLDGVTVELIDTSLGVIVATDITSGAGDYRFDELLGGAFVVAVNTLTLPAGMTATSDPDGLETLDTFAQNLACDETVAFQNFGYAGGSSTTYCEGAPNSVGPGSSISNGGSVSIGAGDFVIEQTGGIPNGFGLFFFGPNAIDVPFGEGHLCVGGGVFRITPALPSDPDGDSSRLLDFTSPPGDLINPGSNWNLQFWYRDPAGGPSGFNLSDALSVTFAP